MVLRHFAKIALAAATLTGAGFAASAPAAAQPFGWGPAHVQTVQYYGGPEWRRYHRGPRCFTERIVRHDRFGRRVVDVRRVCR
jgi:hypothetical protein